MSNIDAIGRNVKRLREEKGWSQEELAVKLGVTDRAVSAWEHGRSYPRMAMLDKLCEVFRCQTRDLTHEYTELRAEVDAVSKEYEQKEESGKDGNEFIILQLFRRLSSENQQKIILEMMNLINK